MNGILRSRVAELDIAVLQRVGLQMTPDEPRPISITFFDDAAITVDIARIERFGSAGTSYIGSVSGPTPGNVVIVEENGVVSGNVDVGGKKYQIRNFGAGEHVLREIDAGAFPPDHDVPSPKVTVRSKSFSPPVAAVSAAADDGSTIDVLVVYTPAARISQGSTAAMNSLVNLGIAETNGAYANSGVTQRVRLVYAGEINYIEVDFATDLSRLQGTADGFMDDVHRLRDLYGADLVSLWGNYSTACGLANLMLTESAAFASQGFSVVDRNCATGNYSFGHELGHNMGLQHDTFEFNPAPTFSPEGNSTPTTIDYAHGYVDMPNRFRSVMALSAQCAAQMPVISCLRIPYFSNPAVTFNNQLFFPGAAANAPTGNSTAREFQALNDTRETVANFRTSVNLAGPGTLVLWPESYTVSENAGSVTLSVARHAGSAGAVAVSYATSSGTATAGADFTSRSGTLAWADGETGTKIITIPILQDVLLEGPESFSITLNGPSGGVSIGAPGTTSVTTAVTITDSNTDSFPSGCMPPLTGWINPPQGAAGWVVATDSFFGPDCSLKSGSITDGAIAKIQFSGDFTAGTISFARRVSSQNVGDCLRFMIDNAEQNIGGTCAGGLGASGEVAWGLVSFPITAGMHTLTWSYQKDGSGSAGADAAWIDSVVLPLGGPPVIVSAPPPGGFLNIPYFHAFAASGTTPITYSLSGSLPTGLTLSTAGVISGTPNSLAPGPFTSFVRAENGFSSFERQLVSINIIALPPGAPVISAAVAANRQASIAFDPPFSQGSAPVTGYNATCNPGAFTANGPVSPISVTQLDNGTEYTCTVTATNIYGTGAASAALLVTPRTTKPGAPVIGTATPGNSQAFVGFTAPESDGGSPITAYTATCNPGALTGSAGFSPVSVSNLANDTTYTCSVTATNNIGTSNASATATVTPSPSPALSLIGTVSRKTHGASGTFDLPVDISTPINGNITVEPRTIGGGHTILLRFNNPIVSVGSISVRDQANLSVGASAMLSGNDVKVTIPMLADRKRISVSLTGVNGTLNPPTVSIGFLVGDVNNTRAVNASDIDGVKLRAGVVPGPGVVTGPLTAKFDIDASGVVDNADVSAVKARSGWVLP